MWLKPFKNIIAKPLDKSNGNGIAASLPVRRQATNTQLTCFCPCSLTPASLAMSAPLQGREGRRFR